MLDIFNAIVALTDAFCTAHLDEEYAHLARQATAKMRFVDAAVFLRYLTRDGSQQAQACVA